MTVVYIDSVFFLNALMDYLLLLATGRLAGIPLRRRRCLMAALIGGVYAAAVFFPGCEVLSAIPVKAAMGVMLALLTFGGEEKLLRLTLLFLVVSCGFAGCVLGLSLLAGTSVPTVNGIFYTDVNVRVLLIASAAAYLVLSIVFRASARHGVAGELLPVQICVQGRSISITALRDTGNGLLDPVTSHPVLVTALGSLDDVFPYGIRHLLNQETLAQPADLLEPLRIAVPTLRFRLVPYRSVGMSAGLLLAVQTDWVEVGGVRYERLLAALSPTKLGTGYAALWGGTVGKGGQYERICDHQADTDLAGIASRPECSLYRRERHHAASVEQGTGSGTSEANWTK